MRPRLIFIYTLIVIAPLALLTWIGVQGVRGEREIVQRRIGELLAGRLEEAEFRVKELLEAHERDLLRSTELLEPNPPALRSWLRHIPIASQVFVLEPDGNRVHPPPSGSLNESEQQFLERAGQIWSDRQWFFRQPESLPGKSFKKASRRFGSAPQSSVSPPPHGWYVWYWGRGINMIFWRRLDSGQVLGVELSRARLLSDVVSRLQVTDPRQSERLDGRIKLLDSKGETICQWGAHMPDDGDVPHASLPLEYPLSAWRLDYFLAPSELDRELSHQMIRSLVIGLLSVGLVLVGLAVFFYRENSRELREAAQRVTFVNQVSHELKTPLTNIRMFAELLRDRTPERDEKDAHHVEVIVTESQRLSRLIRNILTFARKRREQIELHPRPGSIDEVISSVIGYFRPALDSRGIKVTFEALAPGLVMFDPDVLEQVLGNLINNVEKYAAEGASMGITSRRNGAMTVITVTDNGPGIPEKKRDEIFRPFRRLGGKLTEGVSGTGIGLSIARDLARLHGGDVQIMPTEMGSCFEITLHTPSDNESSDR